MSDQHRHGSWDPRIPWRLQPLPQWERPSQLREPKLPGLPMTVISINRPTLEFIFDHLWSWFLVPNFDLCIISNVPYYFISSKVILYNISWLESNLDPCCFVKYPQQFCSYCIFHKLHFKSTLLSQSFGKYGFIHFVFDLHRRMRWKKSGRDFLALGDVTPARIHVLQGALLWITKANKWKVNWV